MVVRFLLVIFLCSSCRFSSDKNTINRMAQEEIESINWQEVDQYPLFENCQESANKHTQKKCFQDAIVQHFLTELSKQKIIVSHKLSDTLFVYLTVKNDGKIKVSSIEITQDIVKQIPQIEKFIKDAVYTLPKIYPATKRGIEVSTKVKLPVVIKTD